MKRISWKKTAVTAAAICMAVSTLAIAAGTKVFTVGGSSHSDEFYQYQEIEKEAEQAGITAKVPESFQNGYVFQRGVPVSNRDEDESGNVLREYQSLSLTYQKEGKEPVMVYILPLNGQEVLKGEAVKEYGGCSIHYSKDEYLFVPPEYEVSEEDRKKEEAGELYISYGSSEVERKTYTGVIWSMEGMQYHLSTWGNMTEDEIYQMAEEIIDMK